jgi:hypothetical protein
MSNDIKSNDIISDDITSYSIIIDDIDKNKFNTYDNLQPRKLKTWVRDETVSQCYHCLVPFTLFNRRTHCRFCKHIFCHKCNNNWTIIPEYFQDSSINNINNIRENINNWYRWLSNKPNTQKQKVCKICFYKIKQLENMKCLIQIFENVELTISEFRNLRLVSKLWNQLANYYLSHFREIQYYLPNHIFSKLDKKLLWGNRHLLISHSKYLVQLLNSIDYEDYNITNQLKDISHLLKTNKRCTTCREMLCTRSCQSQLTPEDALTLLNSKIKSKFIRKYAMHFISKAPLDRVSCYLPYLINKMSCETIEDSVIGNYLINICLQYKDVTLANQIYWQFQVSSECPAKSNIYQYFIQKMETELPKNIIKRIEKVKEIKHTLEKTHDMTNPDIYLEKAIRETVIPTNPQISVYGIDRSLFKVLDSATKPTILPFIKRTHSQEPLEPTLESFESPEPKESSEPTEPKVKKDIDKVHQILYKIDDVRKDLIIVSLIRLMDQILKDEEKLDLHILTYNILPVDSKSGFIDMVPNCETVYKIREKLNYSILNYIIDKNPGENADQLRYRFMKSCAAYCVITYLLGIGDRHLSNIMITNDGYLFHIDFGFVLGYDPKPIREVSMRIFPDMVDALGGVNSHYYNEFKRLCTQTFNCWRKHINLFINFLTLFSDTRPMISTNLLISPEFTQEKIIKEILRRFIPGQNCNQAELILYNCIDSSTQTYHHTVTDFFHYHQQENTLHSLLYSTYYNTKGLMSEIYKYINNNSPPSTK